MMHLHRVPNRSRGRSRMYVRDVHMGEMRYIDDGSIDKMELCNRAAEAVDETLMRGEHRSLQGKFMDIIVVLVEKESIIHHPSGPWYRDYGDKYMKNWERQQQQMFRDSPTRGFVDKIISNSKGTSADDEILLLIN